MRDATEVKTKCLACYGTGGRLVQDGADDVEMEICERCDGTGHEPFETQKAA